MVKVCFFGDSLTTGMLSSGSDKYYPPSAVIARAKKSKWTVINEGIPGDMLSEMPSRLSSLLRDSARKHRGSIDVIAFLGGTNDLRMGRKTEEIVSDLRNIAEISRTNGAALVMITIPGNSSDAIAGIGAKRASVNDFIVGESEELNYTVVDISSALPFGEEEGMYGEDGVHLTRKGYKKVGDLLLQALTAVLKRTSKEK